MSFLFLLSRFFFFALNFQKLAMIYVLISLCLPSEAFAENLESQFMCFFKFGEFLAIIFDIDFSY